MEHIAKALGNQKLVNRVANAATLTTLKQQQQLQEQQQQELLPGLRLLTKQTNAHSHTHTKHNHKHTHTLKAFAEFVLFSLLSFSYVFFKCLYMYFLLCNLILNILKPITAD